jgi:hypothetical protein
MLRAGSFANRFDGTPSFITLWVLSQKGLAEEIPHRHNATRLRISYVAQSAALIMMPPRSQTGPLCPLRGSSTTAIEGSNSGSIGFLVSLSKATRRPELQFAASSRAARLASDTCPHASTTRDVSDDEFSSVKLFSTSEIRRATSSFYVVKMHCFVSLIAILARACRHLRFRSA